jgi:hypothetical protein
MPDQHSFLTEETLEVLTSLAPGVQIELLDHHFENDDVIWDCRSPSRQIPSAGQRK